MTVFVSGWMLGVPLSPRDVFACLGWIEVLTMSVAFYVYTGVDRNITLAKSLQRIQVQLL
jgi:hypothetical protein